jgi:hypothetical protein
MSIDEFTKWYLGNKPTRFITEVHLHHNWKPDKNSYAMAEDKEKVIANVYRMDKDVRGLSDFGQNILITPDGLVWVLRDLNEPPSSIKGRNGNDKFGPMSVVILGNFDNGKEALVGEQEESLLGVLKLLFDIHQISDEKFIFHNEHSPRTSPGSSLNKYELLEKVRLTVGVNPYLPYRDCLDHPNAEYIKYAVENGYFTLYGDGSFHPNALVTRAELARFYASLMSYINPQG